MILLILAAMAGFSFSSSANDPCPAAKPFLKIDSKDAFGQISTANERPTKEIAISESEIPAFLKNKIGEGPDQIAQVVLDRARKAYFTQTNKGKANNVCYMAMDATKPHLLNQKQSDAGSPVQIGHRLYLICESLGIFKALPAGHGGGINLSKRDPTLNLKNGRHCAKYFGNVQDSNFTMGGLYLTGDTDIFFKGRLKQTDGSYCDFYRPFLNMVGEGETANAKQRAIGAHPAVLFNASKELCDLSSPHANRLGYVRYGEKLIEYSGGRTEGCIGLQPEIAPAILAIAQNHPMSIYIYPQKNDIQQMTDASVAEKPYWNAECLKAIGSPVYFGANESPKLENAIRAQNEAEEKAQKILSAREAERRAAIEAGQPDPYPGVAPIKPRCPSVGDAAVTFGPTDPENPIAAPPVPDPKTPAATAR